MTSPKGVPTVENSFADDEASQKGSKSESVTPIGAANSSKLENQKVSIAHLNSDESDDDGTIDATKEDVANDEDDEEADDFTKRL